MIQGVRYSATGIYQLQSKMVSTASQAGMQEAVAIDMDELFTPSERKTMDNIQQYMESQGMSQRDIEMLKGYIAHAKLVEESVSGDVSIKEVIGRQVKGMQDGHIKGNGLSLGFLQNLYHNFSSFQGVNTTA